MVCVRVCVCRGHNNRFWHHKQALQAAVKRYRAAKSEHLCIIDSHFTALPWKPYNILTYSNQFHANLLLIATKIRSGDVEQKEELFGECLWAILPFGNSICHIIPESASRLHDRRNRRRKKIARKLKTNVCMSPRRHAQCQYFRFTVDQLIFSTVTRSTFNFTIRLSPSQ